MKKHILATMTVLVCAIPLTAISAPPTKTAIEKPAQATAPAATPVSPSTAAPALARTWEMVKDKSSIVFHGQQMGTAFDGSIGAFTPVIHFDPAHLDTSKVTVDIDVASIDAKEKERNQNIASKEWFDTKEFPTARFETTRFVKTGDNAFTADAALTIRGITVPVQLPFTLAFSKIDSGKDSGKEQAVMTGKITLDRSKFKLGQGDWADPTIIANEVPVEITLTAVSDFQAPAPLATEKTPTP